MRKLQKFLQRQRGMAENGNSLAKCLQNKDLNKAVTKVFMLMVIFSFAEHARSSGSQPPECSEVALTVAKSQGKHVKKGFTQAKNDNDNNVCSKQCQSRKY